MWAKGSTSLAQGQVEHSSFVSRAPILRRGQSMLASRGGRSLAERLLQAVRSSGLSGTQLPCNSGSLRQRSTLSAAQVGSALGGEQGCSSSSGGGGGAPARQSRSSTRTKAVRAEVPGAAAVSPRIKLLSKKERTDREKALQKDAVSGGHSVQPAGASGAYRPTAPSRVNGHGGPHTVAAAHPPIPTGNPQQQAQVSAVWEKQRNYLEQHPPTNGHAADNGQQQQQWQQSQQQRQQQEEAQGQLPQQPASQSAAASGAAQPLSADGSMDVEALPDEAIQQVYPNTLPPDVHIVDSVAEAQAVAAKLAAFPQDQLAGMVFGCDTEVMDIDVSAQSPCCHGRVICLSIYCGPEHHFGPEASPDINRSMIWVDTYLDGDEARQGEVTQILEAFRPFFESRAHRKVWHNYSFDRHVLERSGYAMRGFGGDTMHMARLWDSSRLTKGGYSLEALTGTPEIMGGGGEGEEAVRGKISMKKLFGRKNLKKDGTEGKLVVLPLVEELQRDPGTKFRWVNYSAYDAKSTWDLYTALRAKLQATDVTGCVDVHVAADFASPGGLAGEPVQLATMWDVYCRFYLPFGELLTDMEAAGLAVDRAHLAEAQRQAEADVEEAVRRFRDWATGAVPDAEWMNVSSGPQVSQLLFAGCANKKADKEGVPLERVFKVPNTTGYIEPGGKRAKKTRDIALHSVWGRGVRSPLEPAVYTPGGAPACNTVVIKQLAGKAGKARKALAELEAKPDTGFERDEAFLARMEGGGKGELGEVLEEEDGSEWIDGDDNEAITSKQIALQQAAQPRDRADLEREAAEKGYGKLYSHFGTAEAGLRACAAVDALVDVSAIDTLLSNFIIPLQSDAISKPDPTGVPRVHCSLNINTETGRLSARRPNLQNQPALEKDRYKVRKAFTADVAAGKTLVVADYGQLELRILAHMANCRSMIEAFELGGDFHSRTALGMYDHIKEAIASGKCLLEWKGGDSGDEPAPAPLLKDLFAAERRKAKVLNFSIAYGKTAHGLSKDWGVSLKEAEETVERWYSDRPEVKAWQKQRRDEAKTLGYVCTLLGRRRQLPDARSSNTAASAHALRAAINTPIQGSAADVAMAAMIRINNDPELKKLGYRLLLQVHDEVILEGPHEHAEAARRRVIECMRSPFNASTDKPLLVDLVVDCKFADTWYEAK